MMRRILVLTSSTGSGHDTRAHTFAQWCHTLLPQETEVSIETVIENGSALGRFGVHLYNAIQRHWPGLHHIYFYIVEGLVRSHRGKVGFGGGYFRQMLLDYQPDVVLSVHDSTNRGYFEDARKTLQKPVRCVTYCGEYSGGYGFSRNWVNPHADCFIARTDECAAWAMKVGMPASLITTFQSFLPISAFPPAQRTQCQWQPPRRIHILLATGGVGANHHIQLLRAALPLADKLHFTIVCGRNEQSLREVHAWLQKHPQVSAECEGFSQRMHAYLLQADAVVTRGGANTTTEAIHFGCPLLFHSLGGTMPQETCTMRPLLRAGAARMISNPAALPAILNGWLQQPASYLQQLHALQAWRRPLEHPRDILPYIIGSSSPLTTSSTAK